jgi:hypothetical protein
VTLTTTIRFFLSQNMGKSGSIWPIPDVVKKGAYGGSKGWGMKSREPTIDGLPKADQV